MKRFAFVAILAALICAGCSKEDGDEIIAVESVELNETTLSLEEGTEATLVATVKPETATNKAVKWESSNPTFASVDVDGKVTALKAGETTITVTTEDGGKTATCTVTVTAKVKTYTLTFEGEAWDALVDSKQYNGPLLYGEGGATYYWFDETTDLYGTLNNGAWSHDFSAGGSAVSNYYSTDYEANGDFQQQLTVYGTGARSGKNCLICYGYNGVYGDSRPVIDFATTAAYIESAYVNLTTYSYAVAVAGNGYAKALTEKEYLKVVATGYTLDAQNNETEVSKAEFYLYKDGKAAISDWTEWDLTALGKINRVKFNVKHGNENGDYTTDLTHPAYFALDDITVAKEK